MQALTGSSIFVYDFVGDRLRICFKSVQSDVFRFEGVGLICWIAVAQNPKPKTLPFTLGPKPEVRPEPKRASCNVELCADRSFDDDMASLKACQKLVEAVGGGGAGSDCR